MSGVLSLSEAAALALHSVELRARNAGQPMTSEGLDQALRCSPSHLAKVTQRRVRSGITDSTRGPGGGFRLGSHSAQTSLLEVYEAIDGKITERYCLLGQEQCSNSDCWYHGFPAMISKRVRENLAGRELSQLAPAARRGKLQ